MTQLRHCKCGLSNEVDRLLSGVGLRGSSYCDIDFLAYDIKTHRFLIQEWKRPNESLSAGQRMALMDLALEERFTVWYVQFWGNGHIAWADMRWPDSLDVLSPVQYKERVRSWWANTYRLDETVELADEIRVRMSSR